MRFMYDSYDKLFPRPEAPEVIETAVPGFTPTADAIQASEPAAPPADPEPVRITPDHPEPAIIPQPEPAREASAPEAAETE